MARPTPRRRDQWGRPSGDLQIIACSLYRPDYILFKYIGEMIVLYANKLRECVSTCKCVINLIGKIPKQKSCLFSLCVAVCT